MKTVLVHGYAGETRMSVFRKPLDETGGFFGLRKQVEDGAAIAFPWGVKKDLLFFEALNPFSYLKIYQAEEKLAADRKTQERLYRFLEEQHATTVMGHSLGCRLIYSTAKQVGLPPTIKRVVWVQAGIEVDAPIANIFPELINLWCPWDPTLLVSSIFLHFDLRAGVAPLEGAKNIFTPLWRLPNLHTSSQKSPALVKWLAF